ncbi:hypothetical protein LJ655_26375 [Paraburkholderia sp. MMS20-SJTN17]|uniref:Uncharacterized protein n=1 Tax=Paraburkholderia translucens TaxID=2886945 RepID=A0ABS8KKR1_9BURK|nr:hypothetical protein [Paraburkholderia sp. MMS20-SJTN17]MCC8405343.1 hypothetical protein [Paraburkholderia sp. MMS20-SJTN17]
MPNESKRLSSTGLTAFRLREGAVLRYYNDSANNCTYGIGTLVHFGPCTAAQFQRPVTLADIEIQLAAAVQAAESAVGKQNIYVHPRDANGRRLPAVRVAGLINRRREEAAPFLTRVQR